MRIFFIAALAVLLSSCGQNTESEKETQVKNDKSREIIDVIEHHPNGAVKLRGKSQGGKRIGKWESFYPTGYRWSEAEYRNGFREGNTVTYYPNGMMRYQGQYYNDERIGVWMFYDTTGVLLERIDMDVTPDPEASTESTGLN